MDNANSPEVLAVVTLPSPEERRCREIMLAYGNTFGVEPL